MTDQRATPSVQAEGFRSELEAAKRELETFKRHWAEDDRDITELETQNNALRTELEACKQALAKAIEVLKMYQWSSRYPGYEGEGSVFACCPACDREDFRGHKDDCEIAAALAKAEEGKA